MNTNHLLQILNLSPPSLLTRHIGQLQEAFKHNIYADSNTMKYTVYSNLCIVYIYSLSQESINFQCLTQFQKITLKRHRHLEKNLGYRTALNP